MKRKTFPLAAALLLIAGCGSGADETAEIIAAVEANETANFAAWQAQGLDALMDTFTDDVVYVDETFGDYFEGKARVRSMYSHVITFADPDGTDLSARFVSADGKWAAITSDGSARTSMACDSICRRL